MTQTPDTTVRFDADAELFYIDPVTVELAGDLGEVTIEAVEDDHSTIDVRLAISTEADLDAAIKALEALRSTVRLTHAVRGW